MTPQQKIEWANHLNNARKVLMLSKHLDTAIQRSRKEFDDPTGPVQQEGWAGYAKAVNAGHGLVQFRG